MINHGRTLLLNRLGEDRPDASYYLEEYVPPDFRPVNLTSSLHKFYEDIIGVDSDNAYANYIVWVLLRAVHAVEQQSLLYDLDPRITYLHDQDVPDYGMNVLVRYEESLIYPNNAFSQPAIRRKLYHRWLLKVNAPFIQVNSMTGEGFLQQPFSGSDGLSDPVILSEKDGLSAKLGVYPFSDDASWDLEAILQPPLGLPELIEKMEGLGGIVEGDIFSGAVEPYVTLKKLWKDHILVHYRIAGYVLAYIYRVEEARLNGE